MEYRELGATGIQVSAIGLGTEHFPMEPDIMAEILSVAVKAGVNLIDVLQTDPAGDGAYIWNGLGPLLREYRDKLVLASHWGIGYAYDLDYCRRTFPDALARTGNDCIDIAMMTMVSEPGRQGAWLDASLKELHRYKKEGHIGSIAASVHDVSAAMDVATSGEIDVLMFAVNMTQYGDSRQQELYRACAEHGVGLIAMKPFSAGLLLRVDDQPTAITPLQCLDYVLAQPISSTVPGVRNADELRDALRYYTAPEAEKDHNSALSVMHQELAGHCVHCRLCMPCPKGINITALIALVNWARGGVQDWQQGIYAGLPVKPTVCNGCGECMEPCDFDVDIVGAMYQAVDLFEPASA